MSLFSRAYQLASRERPIGLLKGIFRFFYWQTGLRSARYTIGYILNGSPVTRTINDTTASFVVTSPQEYACASTAHGDQAVINDLLASLKSDYILYDIGADVGTYTCFAGQIIERHYYGL